MKVLEEGLFFRSGFPVTKKKYERKFESYLKEELVLIVHNRGQHYKMSLFILFHFLSYFEQIINTGCSQPSPL